MLAFFALVTRAAHGAGDAQGQHARHLLRRAEEDDGDVEIADEQADQAASGAASSGSWGAEEAYRDEAEWFPAATTQQQLTSESFLEGADAASVVPPLRLHSSGSLSAGRRLHGAAVLAASSKARSETSRLALEQEQEQALAAEEDEAPSAPMTRSALREALATSGSSGVSQSVAQVRKAVSAENLEEASDITDIGSEAYDEITIPPLPSGEYSTCVETTFEYDDEACADEIRAGTRRRRSANTDFSQAAYRESHFSDASEEWSMTDYDASGAVFAMTRRRDSRSQEYNFARQICATRVDLNVNWAFDLKVICKRATITR